MRLPARLGQQIADRPDPIGQPRFHRRGDAKRAVNAAKVVIGEVQADRGPVVLKLLTEAVGQPRESANLHSHREVLAFNNRCADAFRIRVSDNRDHLRAGDFSGAVARFVALGSRVNLDEPGEVYAVA